MASCVKDGSGSDCEGEEQEDPSSFYYDEDEDSVGNIKTPENEENNPSEDELTAFRKQWKRELEATPQKDATQKQDMEKSKSEEPKEGTVSASDEERAKKYFLRAADLERGGKWYEAILHYKKAMQIVPDIETRLYESTEGRADTPQEEQETAEDDKAEVPNPDSDDEDAVEGEDLLARLQRIQARKGIICEPNTATRETHISCLPFEVILLIAQWVVSSELDAIALERLGQVCRGLYLVARDEDIWRTICIRTWGKDCGNNRAFGFSTWREMYIFRPRLQLHGCYISKTSYLRHGDNSFQDSYYRPWFVIEYYRYLRFFPEGQVLMWTTAEEPRACVAQLRTRTPRPGLGIMAGNYRLIGDKVVIVLKKVNAEKKSPQASNTRFRSRIKEAEHEQTYHIELELRSLKSRRNSQLSWLAYAVSVRRGQWSSFDLAPATFPPFSFSAVRHYSRDARAPLTRW